MIGASKPADAIPGFVWLYQMAAVVNTPKVNAAVKLVLFYWHQGGEA
jgi:hypothetical protein